MELRLEILDVGHASRFVHAAARSAELHHPWVAAPCTAAAFAQYLAKRGDGRNISYVALNDAKVLIGCINLNEIVRGGFQSAYLAYYAFAPFAGQGLMKRAMRLVIAEAFTAHGLHRLEANVQPGNERSKGLVESLGFRFEGFSPKYLMIDGDWRDHERYAITAEDWYDGE